MNGDMNGKGSLHPCALTLVALLHISLPALCASGDTPPVPMHSSRANDADVALSQTGASE